LSEIIGGHSNETILYFSLQTNSVAPAFTSYLDGFSVTLKSGASASVNFEPNPVTTPEPSTFALLGLPLLFAAGLRLRRRA
jgi:hypothetical protein